MDDTFTQLLKQLASRAALQDHLRGLPPTKYLARWYALLSCTLHRRTIARTITSAEHPHKRNHTALPTLQASDIWYDEPTREVPDHIFERTKQAIIQAQQPFLDPHAPEHRSPAQNIAFSQSAFLSSPTPHSTSPSNALSLSSPSVPSPPPPAASAAASSSPPRVRRRISFFTPPLTPFTSETD